MIRNLLLLTGAAFVLAVICFASAAAFGGFHIGRDWAWRHPHDWVRFDRDIVGPTGGGASVTREIAWTGGDRLDVDTSANVQFTQAPGPGKLVVTGPREAVDHLVLNGSHLESDDDGWLSGPVTVVMTAPDVRRFGLSGSGSVEIRNYAQDSLDLDLSGSGRVTAAGKTGSVRLDISGAGEADLAGLQAERADAEISGSGRASVAPTKSADLHISGNGEINLTTHPADVSTDVSGSGRIVEGGAAASAG